MVISNLLIDLDGTLTDPKEGICASIKFAIERMGYKNLLNQNFSWCIGPPLTESFAHILSTNDSKLIDQAVELYRQRFSEIGIYENKLYSDVDQTLAELKQQGYHLFMATSKPTVYARRIAQYFKIGHYFDYIYGSELNGDLANKIDLLKHLLEEEGLEPENCLMIGDRKHDMSAAAAHGIHAVAVNYGYAMAGEFDQFLSIAHIDRFKDIHQVLANH